jgi:hypothetical protein
MIEQLVKNEGLKAGQKKIQKKSCAKKKGFIFVPTTCGCLSPPAGFPPKPEMGPNV